MRQPTLEELRIWEYITRGDEKLPGARIDWGNAVEEEQAAAPASAPSQSTDPELMRELLTRFSAEAMKPAETSLKPDAKPVRAAGDYAGMNAASARKFRRGQMPIDAKLDLHGMFREEAWQALIGFISGAITRQKRCALVITGKGRQGDGTLRRELPRWLTLPPCADWVVAFDQAQPQHGGDGAFYIYLRRQR